MSVYFIEHADSRRPIKIGYTRYRVEARLADLQSGNPYPLVIRAKLHLAGPHTEAWLHEYFNRYRIRGEWFRQGQELSALLAWIDSHPQASLAEVREFLLLEREKRSERARASAKRKRGSKRKDALERIEREIAEGTLTQRYDPNVLRDKTPSPSEIIDALDDTPVNLSRLSEKLHAPKDYLRPLVAALVREGEVEQLPSLQNGAGTTGYRYVLPEDGDDA